MAGTKTNAGNFFEDFRFGQIIPPRDAAHGHRRRRGALYGLYGSRFAVQSSDTFAKAIGYPRAAARRPADLSCRIRQDHAGYLAQRHRQPRLCRLPLSEARLSGRHADARFRRSLASRRTPTAKRARSTSARPGRNQDGEIVLEYCRWVMVRKRDKASPRARGRRAEALPIASIPRTSAPAVPALDVGSYDFALAGSPLSLGRLRGGRENRPRRRHDAGRSRAPDRPRASTRTRPKCTSTSTPNPRAASASASSTAASSSRWRGRCRYNGLGNAFHLAAINGGRHVAPMLRRRYGLCLVGGSRKS